MEARWPQKPCSDTWGAWCTSRSEHILEGPPQVLQQIWFHRNSLDYRPVARVTVSQLSTCLLDSPSFYVCSPHGHCSVSWDVALVTQPVFLVSAHHGLQMFLLPLSLGSGEIVDLVVCGTF